MIVIVVKVYENEKIPVTPQKPAFKHEDLSKNFQYIFTCPTSTPSLRNKITPQILNITGINTPSTIPNEGKGSEFGFITLFLRKIKI